MLGVNSFLYFIDWRLMTQFFLFLKGGSHVRPFFELIVLGMVSESAAFIFFPFVQIGVAVGL